MSLLDARLQSGNETAAAGATGSRPFRALLLYEEAISAHRGAIVAVRLWAGLAPECRFEPSAWRFAQLADPGTEARIAGDAAGCDAVLVSSHSRVIPGFVQKWIDTHLTTSAAHLIYIALTGDDDDWTINLRLESFQRGSPAGDADRLFARGIRGRPVLSP